VGRRKQWKNRTVKSCERRPDKVQSIKVKNFVAIRVAHQENAAALVQLINAAFEVERPIFEGDRIDRGGVLAYLQTGKFLIAEDAAGLAGWVYGERRGQQGYVGFAFGRSGATRKGTRAEIDGSGGRFLSETGMQQSGVAGGQRAHSAAGVLPALGIFGG
jgi:hypothetical protein